MTKRLLCVVMAMLFVVCSVPFAQAAKTSKSVYKPANALSYAKGHWNDGKGLCAEFVSDCLKAGGVDDVYERRVINLYNALKDKGWGTAYKLTLTGGTSGRISMKANEGKVKAGDPVFYYCNVCKQFEHVILCNGADSAGYMKDYAHNNPHDGNRTTYTYRHCGTDNWTMYSIRMDESETLFGTVTSVAAPKVKEATNLENSITIKWNAITGATDYRVYRCLPKGSWVYLETVNGTSYTDTKVENGKTYLYTVRACKKTVWSAYYGGYEATFISPVKFKSSAIADNSIKLTWNTNSSADGYYIYRQKNNGDWVRYADLNKATTSSFVDKDVETGNVYTYRIRAFKGDSVSAYDSAGLKQIFLGTPKMTSIANDLKGITIKWEKLNGSTEYRIYRRGAGEKYWTYLKTVKGNTFTDEAVKSGSYYRYTVRSASGNMYGGFDANGLVIRCIATPKLLTAVPSDKRVNVLWTPVAGATGYYVYHKLAVAKYWTRIATVKGTVYSDANVKVGSTYEYTVKAYYGSTMSSYDAKGISCKVSEAPTTTKPLVTQLVTTTKSELPTISGSQKAVMASEAEVTETTIAVTEPSTEAITEVVTTKPVTEPSKPVIEATEPVTEPVTALD